MKRNALEHVNAQAQEGIYSGFSYEINGIEYMIGYSLFDQINLNGAAIIAMQNHGALIPFQCMDSTGNNVWLQLPSETVIAIHEYGILHHKNAILMSMNEKKNSIMAAENEAEIETIMNN